MGITLSNRLVTAVSVAVIAAGVQALASPAATSARAATPPGAAVVQDAPGGAAQTAAARYWTPARMSAALQAAAGPRPPARKKPAQKKPAPAKTRRLVRRTPGPARPLVRKTAPGPWLTGQTAGKGLRWTHGGTVSAAVGKVFFTLGSADYVCSGTLVGGAHPDVVLTAAHCVSGGPGRDGALRWVTNWIFVPGYHDGLMPYGEYTARQFFAAPGWTGPQGGTEQYDVAFVQVTAATLYGAGPAAAPPGLAVQFTRSQQAPVADRAYVLGYPAEPPYSGLFANYCAGLVTASGGSARTACAMTAGDSGGPWLAGFSPAAGSGTVFAVSTYKLSDNLRVLYGAVLGPQARAVYQRAVSRPR